MPTEVLALSYWLHLLATIAWLGGLALMVLVVSRVVSTSPDAVRINDELYRRYVLVANLSLVVLLATGMMQLTGEKPPNYQGTLNFASLWAKVILVKHLVIGGMIVLAAYTQGVVDPALKRAALLAGRTKDGAGQAPALRRRRTQMQAASLALGVIVLALTAFATAL